MKRPKPITVDFETKPIQARPRHPPEPVGVSIRMPGKPGKYYAWGHLVENNCDKRTAMKALRDVWTSGQDLLFHNGKFDFDVAQVHMGLMDVPIDPLKVHDTQFLLFLLDPHGLSHQLKPAANKWLDIPPDEQDAVRDWLIEHQGELRAAGHIGTERIGKGNSGAYIWLAPGKLVGKYADGDTMRTEKLFIWGWDSLADQGMIPAYQREQKLMPILLRNEREGMRADLGAMQRDLPIYKKAQQQADAWLEKRLKTKDLPFTKPAEMAEILDREGIITEWVMTSTGKKSMNKKNIKPSMYNDVKVFQALGYRAKLQTCISMYYEPWIETASMSKGRVYAGWNQTKNDADAGARTGRLSSSPNFMAVAKGFEDKGDGWSHPEFLKGLPRLPLMRQYLLPDAAGHWWGRRDYNQQELRILGHFEDGLIMEAYRNNPRLDIHKFVQQSIMELLGIELPRTPIKTLNFGLIYGQGVASMAEKIGVSAQEVQGFRKAQFSALPGLKAIDAECKSMGRRGEPIRTWGGRVYYCEEPRLDPASGRWRTFEYKLLNYLIQGSAADCTKEALIRYDSIPHEARFVVTVHDEVNISAPKKIFKQEMLKLRECMMSVEFDLPMLSDAEYGPNWGTMEALKEPEPDFSRWAMA